MKLITVITHLTWKPFLQLICVKQMNGVASCKTDCLYRKWVCFCSVLQPSNNLEEQKCRERCSAWEREATCKNPTWTLLWFKGVLFRYDKKTTVSCYEDSQTENKVNQVMRNKVNFFLFFREIIKACLCDLTQNIILKTEDDKLDNVHFQQKCSVNG